MQQGQVALDHGGYPGLARRVHRALQLRDSVGLAPTSPIKPQHPGFWSPWLAVFSYSSRIAQIGLDRQVCRGKLGREGKERKERKERKGWGGWEEEEPLVVVSGQVQRNL